MVKSKDFACKYHVGDYVYVPDRNELVRGVDDTTPGSRHYSGVGNHRQLIHAGNQFHVPVEQVEGQTQ